MHCLPSHLPFIFLNLLRPSHPIFGRLVHLIIGLDQHLVRHRSQRLQPPTVLRRLLDELEGPLRALELGDGKVEFSVIVGESRKQ